jgi:hypothetical protein
MNRKPFVRRKLPMRYGEMSTNIMMHIFMPTRMPDGNYECWFQIKEGSTLIRKAKVYGVDGLQALLLALQIAVVEVDGVRVARKGEIPASFWNDLRQFMVSSKLPGGN